MTKKRKRLLTALILLGILVGLLIIKLIVSGVVLGSRPTSTLQPILESEYKSYRNLVGMEKAINIVLAIAYIVLLIPIISFFQSYLAFCKKCGNGKYRVVDEKYVGAHTETYTERIVTGQRYDSRTKKIVDTYKDERLQRQVYRYDQIQECSGCQDRKTTRITRRR